MRHVPILACSLFCAALMLPAVLGWAPARAEDRIFIIANQPDGYGVDHCLAKGERCGETVARAYCKSKEFVEATGFRKVEPEDATGVLPREARTEIGSYGGDFVAITCRR